MRKLLLVSATILFVNILIAQQKEGKVIYERTIQMEIQINDNDEASQMLPKTRTDKFELTFGNNQSIWKHVDEEEDNDEFGGNGMQIRMVGPGQNDIVFYDFTNARKVEQREMFDKKFIVADSIRKLNWKLTGETTNYSWPRLPESDCTKYRQTNADDNGQWQNGKKRDH